MVSVCLHFNFLKMLNFMVFNNSCSCVCYMFFLWKMNQDIDCDSEEE